MARKPRIEYPGAFFHIIVRGNNRELVFREKADYLYYLEKLVYFCQEGDLTLYAYCLMPNHLHLLLEMGKVPVSKILQRFHTGYTQHFNKKYGRVGHVFQGRYKAILCDRDAYLLELVRYIHLNPVRARLVEYPEDYPWSSHRTYIGQDRFEAIDPSFVLGQFSNNLSTAKESYRSFVMQGDRERRRTDFYRVNDQRILGNETFQKQVSEHVRAENGGIPELTTVHFELDELEEVVQEAMRLESGSLMSSGQFGAWTRRVFSYIARAHGAHKVKDVARYIGKDLATVTHGVRYVQNLLQRGDQKTTATIQRILDTMNRRRISWKEKEKVLTSFLRERKGEITIAYLFGSQVGENAGPLSDVDIAVYLGDERRAEDRYDLAFQIRRLLGVEDLDLIVLNQSPIELKYRVITDGTVIFCEDLTTKVEFEARVLSQYGDYLPILERQRREILEASYGAAAVQRYREAFGQTERMLKQIGTVQRKAER